MPDALQKLPALLSFTPDLVQELIVGVQVIFIWHLAPPSALFLVAQ